MTPARARVAGSRAVIVKGSCESTVGARLMGFGLCGRRWVSVRADRAPLADRVPTTSQSTPRARSVYSEAEIMRTRAHTSRGHDLLRRFTGLHARPGRRPRPCRRLRPPPRAYP